MCGNEDYCSSDCPTCSVSIAFQQVTTCAPLFSELWKPVFSVFCISFYVKSTRITSSCLFIFLLKTEHYESREACQTSGTSPDRWKGTVYYNFLDILLNFLYSVNAMCWQMSKCPVLKSQSGLSLAGCCSFEGVWWHSASARSSSWPQHSLYGGEHWPLHLGPLWLCSNALWGLQPHTRWRYSCCDRGLVPFSRLHHTDIF